MIEPTPAQIAAAHRLGVSLRFNDAPLTIARLIEMIEQLQYRVAALEKEKSSWLKPLRK